VEPDERFYTIGNYSARLATCGGSPRVFSGGWGWLSQPQPPLKTLRTAAGSEKIERDLSSCYNLLIFPGHAGTLKSSSLEQV